MRVKSVLKVMLLVTVTVAVCQGYHFVKEHPSSIPMAKIGWKMGVIYAKNWIHQDYLHMVLTRVAISLNVLVLSTWVLAWFLFLEKPIDIIKECTKNNRVSLCCSCHTSNQGKERVNPKERDIK